MVYSRLNKYSLIILFTIISCNRIAITWNLNKRPEVETTLVEVINGSSAIFNGNIIDDGGSKVKERGILYSLHNNPTLTDSVVNCGSGIGPFSVKVTGLDPGTRYYLKAYAINETGTGYGDVVYFTTVPYSMKTNQVNLVTYTTARSGGNISSDGGEQITSRGVCWSQSVNPTINDSKTDDGKGKGSFISNISGLIPGTTYRLRAYATNNIGTIYGNELTFNTLKITLPTVTTTTTSLVTPYSVKTGGNITSDGGSNITSKGVCWNTTGAPTIADNRTNDGTGSGIYSSLLTGLQPVTKYYFRAYATNSIGTAYGNQLYVTTTSNLPALITTMISSITTFSAKSGGNIIYDGYSSIIGRGVCWNTSGNPTIADNKTNDGNGDGTFISTITGLQPKTRYYVKAYATNNAGTVYGSQFSFFTHTANALIPVNGLVAYFPFNGNPNDESGNEINGTVFGPTLITDRHGSTNSAYNFDGVNDYIKADASKLPSAERTISLWFKANSVDNRPGLFGYGGNTVGTSFFMGLNVNGLNSFHLSCHYLVNRIDYYYSLSPVNEWYHWVITTSNNGTRLYVNGDIKASNSVFIKNTYINGRQLGIGAISSSSGIVPYTDGNVKYFNGFIDDIRIYNRALTNEEIQVLYHEDGWKQ
ncbi:MAG TPA: hypothetical protein DDW27_04295 [Bacteroidales bacterium]|nr:hypothetical protein [Bacteroidales bacterium]